MLHTGDFNERFDHSTIDDEEQPEDDEDEIDNYIKGPTVINPKICSNCKKHILEVRRYHKKDTENNVLYCDNCGYLCIICGISLPDPSKRSRIAIIKCANGHSL